MSGLSKVVPVRKWLEQNHSRIVEQIVNRARAELPDYRERDVTELTEAADYSTRVWYTSILTGDFYISKHNSAQTIKQNIQQRRDPEQVSRTPQIQLEVVREMMLAAGDRLDSAERGNFLKAAEQFTTLMVRVGRLQIATSVIGRVTGELRDHNQSTNPPNLKPGD